MKYPVIQKNILGAPFRNGQEYTIVGAGMSGLMLGYQLKQRGIPFRILEKNNQPGGLVYTHEIEGLGLAEQAANGFVWCDEIAEMCETLGLEIQQPDATSKARYLVRDNQLRKYPLGVLETLGMMGKLSLPHSNKLETVEDFGHTFFGKKFTNQILEPAFSGIYAAPISELSFRAVLRPFAEQLNHTNFLPNAIRRWRKMAKQQGSTRKKLSGTQSFVGGFGTLPIKLSEYLSEHIQYGETIQNIDHKHTILTSPANVSASYFEGELKTLLESVKYTPIISTTMIFKKSDFKDFKPGFGCLIPRSEGLTILGVLFNSYIFPDRVENEEHISLTCLFRDYEGNYIHQDEQEIINSVLLPDLRKLLGLKGELLGHKMFKWERGIPIYDNQLADSWIRMDELLLENYPSIRLLGNYTGQISIRGMAQFIPKWLS